mmetsp:Transcript_107425/g.310482  ORF Transcript_107425/g.310482 Transcript_107425/m.310482 type:complete len:231 (+) Transcript_107425:71-763(+)
MFMCSPCCAEVVGDFEAPLRSERMLPPDADVGTFDDGAAAEAFGQMASQNSPASVFHALVQIEDEGDLGMHLDITPKDRLRISKIEDRGPVVAYNAGVAESLRVREGDLILSVNGVTADCKAKVGALAACGRMDLEIGRARTFVVRVPDASQGKLGLDLVVHPAGAAAYITQVFSKGLVQTWNQQNPELDVRSGDMIIAVNGQTGTSLELTQLAVSTSKLELTITRPAEA